MAISSVLLLCWFPANLSRHQGRNHLLEQCPQPEMVMQSFAAIVAVMAEMLHEIVTTDPGGSHLHQGDEDHHLETVETTDDDPCPLQDPEGPCLRQGPVCPAPHHAGASPLPEIGISLEGGHRFDEAQPDAAPGHLLSRGALQQLQLNGLFVAEAKAAAVAAVTAALDLQAEAFHLILDHRDWRVHADLSFQA